MRRGGKEYVSFSCNDYLGLTHHPRVIAAAREALERYGTGAGASRLVTGSHPPYAVLEQLLAELKGTERALVFGSGYMANLGVIPALVGKNDLILADRLCHACMWDGTRLSGATVMRFDHNSLDHCRELLRRHRAGFERCLILTETVFSMEGDLGPVAELSKLARCPRRLADDRRRPRPGDLLGARGRRADGDALQGGRQLRRICLRRSEVIALLENKARSLLFATGLPPASVAAASAALAIIQEDESLRAKAARERPTVHDGTRTTAGAKPDRARDRRRGRGALAASAMLEATRLPGRRDPAPHRAAGNGPAAIRLLGDASTATISTAPRRS